MEWLLGTLDLLGTADGEIDAMTRIVVVALLLAAAIAVAVWPLDPPSRKVLR